MNATTNSDTYEVCYYVNGEFRVHPLVFFCAKTAQRYAEELEGNCVSGGHVMNPYARVRAVTAPAARA